MDDAEAQAPTDPGFGFHWDMRAALHGLATLSAAYRRRSETRLLRSSCIDGIRCTQRIPQRTTAASTVSDSRSYWRSTHDFQRYCHAILQRRRELQRGDPTLRNQTLCRSALDRHPRHTDLDQRPTPTRRLLFYWPTYQADD